VIIDKVAAEVFVFGADGQLRGAPRPCSVSLAATFDARRGRPRTVPHPSRERTTPARRFRAGFWMQKPSRAVPTDAIISVAGHSFAPSSWSDGYSQAIEDGALGIGAFAWPDLGRDVIAGGSSREGAGQGRQC